MDASHTNPQNWREWRRLCAFGLLDIDVLAGLTAQDGRDRVPVVGRADDQSVDILVVEHPAELAEDERMKTSRNTRTKHRRGTNWL